LNSEFHFGIFTNILVRLASTDHTGFPSGVQGPCQRQTSLPELLCQGTDFRISSAQSNRIKKAFAKFVTLNNHAFLAVEKEGFKEVLDVAMEIQHMYAHENMKINLKIVFYREICYSKQLYIFLQLHKI
jgi:DNA-binding XRE family transcriptional regulator